MMHDVAEITEQLRTEFIRRGWEEESANYIADHGRTEDPKLFALMVRRVLGIKSFRYQKPSRRTQKAKIPSSIRWAVWERDNFTCLHCGTRRYLSLDHIIAESRGGPSTIENLQTLCRSCNSKKGAL